MRLFYTTTFCEKGLSLSFAFQKKGMKTNYKDEGITVNFN